MAVAGSGFISRSHGYPDRSYIITLGFDEKFVIRA